MSDNNRFQTGNLKCYVLKVANFLRNVLLSLYFPTKLWLLSAKMTTYYIYIFTIIHIYIYISAKYKNFLAIFSANSENLVSKSLKKDHTKIYLPTKEKEKERKGEKERSHKLANKGCRYT